MLTVYVSAKRIKASGVKGMQWTINCFTLNWQQLLSLNEAAWALHARGVAKRDSLTVFVSPEPFPHKAWLQ